MLSWATSIWPWITIVVKALSQVFDYQYMQFFSRPLVSLYWPYACLWWQVICWHNTRDLLMLCWSSLETLLRPSMFTAKHYALMLRCFSDNFSILNSVCNTIPNIIENNCETCFNMPNGKFFAYLSSHWKMIYWVGPFCEDCTFPRNLETSNLGEG